jgi:hypothetical protein
MFSSNYLHLLRWTHRHSHLLIVHCRVIPLLITLGKNLLFTFYLVKGPQTFHIF